MTPPIPWRPEPERYRQLLTLQVRQMMHRDARLRRRFDSSDVVQDTFLKAHEKLAQFRGTSDMELLRWLQEILATALKDAARKARAKKRDVALEQTVEKAVAESSAQIQAYLAKDPSPSDQAERNELLLRIAAAVDQLPAEQRDVIIQRDLLGASVAQIAADMGRSEKSVAGLLFRGRRRLRELLPNLE